MPLKRRTFLVTGAVGALAGCSLLPDRSRREPRSNPFHLHGVEIQNEHGGQHAVQLLVRRDGTIVHWDEHAVSPADSNEEGRGGTILIVDSSAWPVCAERFQISARLDETRTWTHLDVPNERTPAREANQPHLARVIISEEEDVSATTLPVDNDLDCETMA